MGTVCAYPTNVATSIGDTVMAFLSKKKLEFKVLIGAAVTAVMGAVAVAGVVRAAVDAQPDAITQKDRPLQVLFTNVNIFNGADGKLIKSGFVRSH